MVLKGMGAVIVAFAAVTFTHVSVVVIIVALTASLPFRILIPTSNIGRTNLLSHRFYVVGFNDCIDDFQVPDSCAWHSKKYASRRRRSFFF